MKLVLGCLFLLIAIEAYLAPYTKVEESFNLQATHDILHQVDHYDHLEFPGVVPRTFVGACLLSALSWPIVHFIPSLTMLDEQIVVRIMLGLLVVIALGKFASGVKDVFGDKAANWTVLLLLCQFHFVFWSSRTLPNTLALPWTLLGLSHWVSSLSQTGGRTGHLKWMIRYLTFTSVVFRFEVGILLVVVVCAELMHRTIAVKTVVREMVVTGLLSLLATVPLDSYLWQTWLWPEGEVFYFNAILNKSSEWGTLPFHAYFTSFLPRLLLVSYPLAGVAFGTDSRARRLLTPMLAYVALFSCLPHKEWRFIMYTIPVFTAAAASSVSSAITAASRSFFRRLLLLGTLGAVLASFGIALAMFQISRLNYPGGHALASLHAIEQNKPYVSVHLDVDTAMTGASLFGHANRHWHYSKNETHKTEADFLDAHYTHLITAHPERFDSSLFKVIDTTYGLDTVQLKSLSQWQDELHRGDLLPVRFNMAPKLYTLRLDKPYQAWIQSTLRKHPFVLYSKTYCPYSMAAKRLLSKYCKDVHVVEANLDRDPDEVKFALFHLTRQATFPNFFKNGQSLGGYDQLMALEREGKLAGICNA